jgi:hypothetical protein
MSSQIDWQPTPCFIKPEVEKKTSFSIECNVLTGQVEKYMQTCRRKSKQVTEVSDDSCEAFQNRAFVAHE